MEPIVALKIENVFHSQHLSKSGVLSKISLYYS
jgi:hypothetical protein